MDLKTRLTAMVAALDVLPAARVDAINRGIAHFTGEPTQADLDAWSASLRETCPHFFARAPEIPAWLSPSERLTRARAAGGGTARTRVPSQAAASPPPAAMVDQWAKLPPSQRLTAFRAWQREQAQATHGS